MNKNLCMYRNIIFLIAIILLVVLRFISSTMTLPIAIMYVLSVLLLIINFVDYKKNHTSNNDKTYNIIYILTSVFMIIVLVRSMFDPSLITVQFIKDFTTDMFYNMAFLKANLIYINILLVCVLVYRLMYSMPNITIQVNSKETKSKSKK